METQASYRARVWRGINARRAVQAFILRSSSHSQETVQLFVDAICGQALTRRRG
jgi:hypothetical protein